MFRYKKSFRRKQVDNQIRQAKLKFKTKIKKPSFNVIIIIIERLISQVYLLPTSYLSLLYYNKGDINVTVDNDDDHKNHKIMNQTLNITSP